MIILPAGSTWRAPQVEAAARKILDAGLGRGTSSIEPNVQSWEPESAQELYTRIVENEDTSRNTFQHKLRLELAGASRATHLLTAELMYLHVLPLQNVTPKTKQQRISTMLSWLRPPAALPADLEDALGTRGAFSGGAGFNLRIWRQIGWLVSFVEHWWSQPEEVRRVAFRDPWAFQEIVDSLENDQPGIRNSLLYLAFPDTFFPIASQKHKRAIRNAFAALIGGPSGEDAASIDHDLAAVYQIHNAQPGTAAVNYYHEPYASQWQKLSGDGDRAWLVRPRQAGKEFVELWRTDGFVSLGATHLGEVPPESSRDLVRAAVEEGYQHLDYAQRLSLATEYHSFLSVMKVDDLVATIADDRLFVGVVTGVPEYTAEATARLRRAVAWSAADGVPVGELGAPLPEYLAQQGTVVDLTAALAVVTALTRSETPEPDEALPCAPLLSQPIGPPVLRKATTELAGRLHIDVPWLQEIIELLQDRQQIVLYGPPGTGKTYIARELARHVADSDAVRLVQFHPSYSYEDFFEGYRPSKAPDGSVGFELHPGPLRQLAADARPDQQRPYILVIDEINRANLAKVFGELYFLLEYRHDTIRLQYSPGEGFTLPPNVFFIGTMNTADRSIALLDSAIRRRFAFVELHPDEPPVGDLLLRWLQANGNVGDERAALLVALNAEIGAEDHDYKIGPSYLMKPDAEHGDGLHRVWEYSILPLLEEHYYGRLTRRDVRERFGLDGLRRKTAIIEHTNAVEP
jgi:5-methylcytosine-specific restriction protein B